MTERQSYYVGVKGIIKNDAGDVLILKDAKYGKWEVPGGRIDDHGPDHTIEQALGLEIEQELPGAKLERLGDLTHAAQGDFAVENNHRLLLVFYLARVSLPAVLKLSEEHDASAWVSKENIHEYDMFSTDQEAVRISLTRATTE